VLDFGAMHPAKVCQPARRGHGRHPVLLPKSVFRQLAGSTARTLKGFLAVRVRRIALCELDDPGLDLDIDWPEDYERAVLLRNRQARSKPHHKLLSGAAARVCRDGAACHSSSISGGVGP
jgi:hypothetical protein